MHYFVHDVCLQNLNVTLCLDRAGLVGEDGATHHGVFDISFLRHIPGLVIMVPRNEPELQHMLATALAHKGPVALRYPRGVGEGGGGWREGQGEHGEGDKDGERGEDGVGGEGGGCGDGAGDGCRGRRRPRRRCFPGSTATKAAR